MKAVKTKLNPIVPKENPEKKSIKKPVAAAAGQLFLTPFHIVRSKIKTRTKLGPLPRQDKNKCGKPICAIIARKKTRIVRKVFMEIFLLWFGPGQKNLFGFLFNHENFVQSVEVYHCLYLYSL